jgi:hypothetical protein
MKNTANAAPCRHRKLRPELRYDIDLFDVAREQEHLQSEAVRHIARFRDRRAAEWRRAMTKKEDPAPRANAGNRANSKVEQHQIIASPVDWKPTRTSWGAR